MASNPQETGRENSQVKLRFSKAQREQIEHVTSNGHRTFQIDLFDCSETKDSPGAKVSDGVEPSTSGVPAKKPRNPNVPILPFGTDLLHWGEENVEVPLIVR